MNKIIYIGDFIEGQPRIASVRYNDIFKNLSQNYDFICLNNIAKGKEKSLYCIKNFKYKTGENEKIYQVNSPRKNKLKWILKKTYIYKIYKSKELSKNNFYNNNKQMINEVYNYIENNDVKGIFVSVPSIFPIYLLNKIKKQYPKLPVIVEIRDIINSELYKDYPRKILKKIELDIVNNADIIIALSNGIKEYYLSLGYKKNIEVITNGFSEELFSDFYLNEVKQKEKLVFTHIGSIYGGRNIKDFIIALNKLANKTRSIELNLIGKLDSIAIEDINAVKTCLKDEFLVNVVGLISHENVLKELKKSDYGVILTHKVGSDYAIPGKTFEYIAAYKPMIVVTEDKELIELVHNKFGFCAKHSVDDIYLNLKKLINSSFTFETRDQYNRKNQIVKINTCIRNTFFEKEV